jgi:hypothetical protein
MARAARTPVWQFTIPLGTLPVLLLGGIIENQNSEFVKFTGTDLRGRLEARQTRYRGFGRVATNLGSECGHPLIKKEILSNSPFGRTTQTFAQICAVDRQRGRLAIADSPNSMRI